MKERAVLDIGDRVDAVVAGVAKPELFGRRRVGVVVKIVPRAGIGVFELGATKTPFFLAGAKKLEEEAEG